jgi:hypothetical protein
MPERRGVPGRRSLAKKRLPARRLRVDHLSCQIRRARGNLSARFAAAGPERDVPRYRGLCDIEDFGPYKPDDVLPQISAGNYQRLAQVQFPWASFSFIPWFFEEFADHLLQFIELR